MPRARTDHGENTLLRIEGVTVRFGGIVALDGVSFEVRRGEICALIGPNGAGKSTLFNCLSRLYDSNAGHIAFDGHVFTHMPRHRMAGIGIGRTFQNLALFRSMTVRDNVLVGCHSHHHAGFLRNAFRLPGVAGIVSRRRRPRARRPRHIHGADNAGKSPRGGLWPCRQRRPSVFLDPHTMTGVLLYAFAGALVGGIDSPVGEAQCWAASSSACRKT
ncbi:ATP-binding cassette domain-containing protein [Ramlibacter sp. WS9]|uniref:ATP-binding cassette domain-containing protein n=1 Tax=Ramlibacter sp. WS9 TaxID=1882741 RepID=UPI001E621469|nr:ATP-binding cassette domain-containing protein [Ramlibacter sp. WS9]